jgi:hypothetical protein
MFARMWPFASHSVEVQSLPLPTDEERLAEIEKEFHVADREFVAACLACARYALQHKDARTFMLNDQLYARVNAMSRDPILAGLERAREQARLRRSARLKERADLRLQLKLIS